MNKFNLSLIKNIILLSKPSKAIRLFLMVLFVSSFANVASAQTNTWNGSSSVNWNTAANWSLGLVPTAAHDVVIPNSNATNANPIVNTAAVCKTFTMSNGNRANNITISGSNSLTVSGAVTIGAGSGSGDDKLLNVGVGTLSCASIAVAGTGSANRTSGVTLSSGIINVTGNITMGDTNDDFTFIGAGTLNVGGTITGGTLIPSTGTVNYNNSGAQTIGIYSYYNLILSGSGTKTFGVASAITNNFSITTGVIANLGNGLSHSAGVLTLGGQGTVPGSWGSTSSTATNKDNTYFAATTGRINNSCTAPTINTQPTALSICENTGGSFSVSATGASTYQWQYSGDNANWINIDAALNPYVAGYTTATFTLTNTPAAWTGNYVRCVMWSSTGCRTNSSSVLLTVKALPVITSNKVDETCPVSNNGTISPTFSGGISNVRYIKLTQKYASWQQVAEIQAFEIFSGTNLALSSGGAVASASSVYSTDYLAAEVNDGVTATNGNMWHSANASINEWIQIDLQSAKNIDYLRIFNRTDCCQDRGQNMLLELFDASNTLVYSKTIDLYQSGANVPVNVNVLDVSWTDGASTLNRTALDSGTYTLNYADAFGCAVSSPISIGSTYPASVGGTVSGGSTPICQGSPIGTLALSGQVGTVVQWDRRLNSGTWEYAGGSTTTFSETPYAAGTWEYRALVQSGSCTSAYSSIQTIVVSPTSVGGGIYTGNTAICINSSTGAMNLTGYTGSVIRWEKRLLPSATWTTIANTTDTYTESPSVGGTWEYRALVGSGSCSSVYSSVRSVTVNPELTITLTNSNPTICQTTTTASFTYSATTGSPSACIVSFDSAAISAGFSSPQTTGLGAGNISVNVPWGAAAGVYNGSLTVITYWPVCSSVSYPISVTVGVTTPTVGVITQPNCSTPTGSVVLSGLPVSGTLNQTGTVTNSYTITGTSMTISGLAAGTYAFSVSNGSCTSSSTGNVIFNAVITNTWNGSAWSNGTPNSTQKIVFSGNYPPTVDPNVDIVGCSCKVTGSTNVVIKTGRNLIITNEVTVIGTGTLTFEDTSSLLQTNNVTNSGNIIYKRTTSSVLTSDYTYWSSPVANQNLNISPSYGSGMFYSYDDFALPEDWKKESSSTIMAVGKGYIIRGPQTTSPPPPPGLYTATFTGVPNNGTKTIAIGPTGTSNLLGNPYPSAIDADVFLSTNSSLVEGTIYFWTHNTAIQLASNITNGTAGTGALAYTSDDYASYNGTGGAATSGGVVPTGKIAAGQAFFTTSKATGGSVTFSNIMRLAGTTLADKTGVNQQFFKTKNPKAKTTNTVEKNRVWLNLTNNQGAFKQTLVGYVTDATNDYDSRFDGETFDGNEFVDFYSINQDKNLVIQGRALPFDENDVVPLGFRSAIDGDFTINIDQTDGLLTNQEVFLEDKLTNKTVNLKEGKYDFNTSAGTFNDRFVLRYTSKTLGTNDLEISPNKVLVSIKNKQIKIDSFAETIDQVAIYDEAGRQIYQKNKVNSTELSISNLVSNHQILIVKTSLQNGKTVSNKIIY